LRRSTRNVEDGLLLVVSVHGGSVRRGHVNRAKACAAGSLPGNRAQAISMFLAQVSGWSAIFVCWPSAAAGALHKDAVVIHVKCIRDLCTLPLDIPYYLHHILVIFMLFDDYCK
jgi:hypothetical protein